MSWDGAEPPGEGLQQVPRDRRVLLDERPELPIGEPVAHEVGRRGDRRRARAVVDQRDLAEVVARGEAGEFAVARRDRGLARLDDEERGATGALPRDRLTRIEAPLLEHRGDALDVARGQAVEERDLLDDLHGLGVDRRRRGPRRAAGAGDRPALQEVEVSAGERPLDVAGRARTPRRIAPRAR